MGSLNIHAHLSIWAYISFPVMFQLFNCGHLPDRKVMGPDNGIICAYYTVWFPRQIKCILRANKTPKSFGGAKRPQRQWLSVKDS
jgi:hypothetical protein